jgi:hypothetical protein
MDATVAATGLLLNETIVMSDTEVRPIDGLRVELYTAGLFEIYRTLPPVYCNKNCCPADEAERMVRHTGAQVLSVGDQVP